MGFIRELIIDGLLFRAARRFEELKGRHPLRKAKLYAMLFVLAAVSLPLFVLTVALQSALIVWDALDPFSLDVPVPLHYVFFIVHAGVLVLSYYQTKELHAMLSILYSPAERKGKNGFEKPDAPLLTNLFKKAVTMLLVFAASFSIIVADGLLEGFTAVHPALVLTIVITCSIILTVSFLFHIAARSAVLILVEHVLKRLDRKYGMGKF